MWTPDGLVNNQTGTASVTEIGDHVQRQVTISRLTDPLPIPTGASGIARARQIELPIDGVIGLRVLGAFDVTIDSLAGKAWLETRDEKSFICHTKPSGQYRGTTGFSPWLYKGQGVVRILVHGSPAEAAGIRPGDGIVSINDVTVPEYYDHLDATCLTPEPVKVVFHNASGDHTVVLTPAVQ
jgi:hypothetical protein